MKSPILSTNEIQQILKKRIDQQKQSVGIVAGVIDPNGRRIIAHGNLANNAPRPVDGSTIFEIGSITKVFTSLLLADMANRKELALDDPASKYLPENVRMPERSGKPITLLDLSTHYSGLPPMPDNIKPNADYSIDDLYQFLSGYTLPRDPGSEYGYSNLGAGLLGHILAHRTGTDYEILIRTRITKPLNMLDTGITLSPSMKERMATGHNAILPLDTHSEFPAPLVGAGALRSSANDMLTFLEAFLGYRESSLAPAMKAMLEVRRPAGKMQIGLGWLMLSSHGREIVGHNGATRGFCSTVGYDPEARVGVVALTNTFTLIGIDDIAMHLLNPESPLANLDLPEQHSGISSDPTLFDRYRGRYQMQDRVFEIRRTGDRLFAQVTAVGDKPFAGPVFEMFAESEKKFLVQATGSHITFETNPDGDATSLTMHRAGREPTTGARIS